MPHYLDGVEWLGPCFPERYPSGNAKHFAARPTQKYFFSVRTVGRRSHGSENQFESGSDRGDTENSAFRYTSGSDLTAPSVTRGVLSQAIAYRRAGARLLPASAAIRSSIVLNKEGIEPNTDQHLSK